MVETAYAQIRFAASMLFARPFHLPSLNRLIDALRETRHEFGILSGEASEMLGSPSLDEESLREIQLRRFRQQARRGAEDTPHYADMFQRVGLNPQKLTWEDIQRLPLTRKTFVRDHSQSLVRHGQHPNLRTTTTGTTGKPTSMFFTQHEMDAYVSLNALTHLLKNSMASQDIVQVSTSARAMLANSVFIGASQRVGALVYQTGIIEPEQALTQLTEKHTLPGKKSRASVLLTYPSYLGKLIETGLKMGLGPDDFGLEHIHIGGEIVTEDIKRRSQALFGSVQIHEGYGITEAWPLGGIVCEHGHLHFEPSTGLVEVLDPITGQPAKPGEVGSLVLTPFAPYRESMVILRYNTEDLVQILDEPLNCSLKHFPATSKLLGKQRLSVHTPHGWITPREVLEAIESIDEIPLPARAGFQPLGDGISVEVSVSEVTPALQEKIEKALLSQNIPVRALSLTIDPTQLSNPLPWRGDLHESSFVVTR